MFDYKKPCNNCPFRVSVGASYSLRKERVLEIFNADAFECHKTTGVMGEVKKPQQCAGLIALQHKERAYNTITRVAITLTGYDPSSVDGSDVYDTLAECIADHTRGKND